MGVFETNVCATYDKSFSIQIKHGCAIFELHLICIHGLKALGNSRTIYDWHLFLIKLNQFEKSRFITRPNCALDRSTNLCLYVAGFQKKVFKHVKILSERSKETKEQKKNKGSVIVAQFGLVMLIDKFFIPLGNLKIKIIF